MTAHPSLMLHSPASYIKLEEAMTKEHHDTDFALINDAINNTAISTNSTEEQETATDELEAITNHLIRQVGQNAIESESGDLHQSKGSEYEPEFGQFFLQIMPKQQQQYSRKQLHKPLANAADQIKISSKGSKFLLQCSLEGWPHSFAQFS